MGQKRKEMMSLEGVEYEVGSVWKIVICDVSESLAGTYAKCSTKCT